ncbi:hypothetical protein Tco_0607091, partial [Tanacetum coccineum]
MASLDRRLNPLYTIKECSSCGNLYTKDCGCSKGSLKDKILTLEEVFQDFQDTSESSDDDTNLVNENEEPFVVNQDPGKNSSQSPPHIDHCCYGCGDSLDNIFCQRCTCESCGKGAHYGYNCPSQVPIISKPEPCNSQTVNEFPQSLPSVHLTSYSRDKNSFTYDSKPNFVDDSPNIPICYDDEEDYTIAITPVLSIEEPVDSLIMEDEHLDTIPAIELDEVIKSSVENLVLIPSESEGIHDNVCDMPLCNNPTPLEAFKEHSDDSNSDYSSSDDDSYENIDYVDASPPDAEIVCLEVVEIVIPEVGGIDDDILLTIKDDILREKLLNVNLLIVNIEALKDNPTPSFDFVIKSPSTFPNSFLEETDTFDNSLTESETFHFNLEEISSGSTTTRSDYSLPDYEAFYHNEERSSGSTTTHSDYSLSKYDSFIFDLSIDLFPLADRSDFYHEEFADELAHIISPPEYDCFYFKSKLDPRNL